MTTPSTILDFWFGKLSSPEDYPKEKAKLWFLKNPEFDLKIKKQFEDTLLQASKGKYDHWKGESKGLLSLLVLFDQFSRNIYRGTPQAFAFDSLALSLCLEGVERAFDQQLLPVERLFFYLPLEHSEELSMQDLSVKKYEELVKESPPSLKDEMLFALKYAKSHRDIIEKFHRFPHRNNTLGRRSSKQEEDFLLTPGSSF